MKVLIICGPTASGKTDLAYKIAREKGGVIINADSMQIYQDIPILSASPSLEQQKNIPHFLYNYVEVSKVYNVAIFIEHVKEVIQQLQPGQLPIIVGGTGLYINALLNGISDIASVDEAVRDYARQHCASIGNQAFYDELVELDPEAAAKLNPGDTQRIIRAYEVIKSTGKSILYWQQNSKPSKPIDAEFEVVMLAPERSFLYETCNNRFVKLLEQGAIEEVQKLLHLSPDLQVTKALGFNEIREYLLGQIAKDEMINLAQARTRQYAKRQLTWFRNQIPQKKVLEYSGVAEYQDLFNLYFDARVRQGNQ